MLRLLFIHFLAVFLPVGGNYPVDDPPVAGLSVARQFAMISYRTAVAYRQKFGRERVTTPESINRGKPRLPTGSTRFCLGRCIRCVPPWVYSSMFSSGVMHATQTMLSFY